MKVFTIIFCLFLSVGTSAQDDTLYKDTSKKFMIVDAREPKKREKVLYIINDKPYYKISIKNDIDIKNILYVEVLKKDIRKYGPEAANGVVVIVYKTFAISSYQNKLSAFSKEYRTYLAAHRNQDKDFQYELNGLVLENDYFDNIKKLYKIPSEDIKRVDFLKNPDHNGFADKSTIVNILTKK